jgi:hypothetical protein
MLRGAGGLHTLEVVAPGAWASHYLLQPPREQEHATHKYSVHVANDEAVRATTKSSAALGAQHGRLAPP